MRNLKCYSVWLHTCDGVLLVRIKDATVGSDTVLFRSSSLHFEDDGIVGGVFQDKIGCYDVSEGT